MLIGIYSLERTEFPYIILVPNYDGGWGQKNIGCQYKMRHLTNKSNSNC